MTNEEETKQLEIKAKELLQKFADIMVEYAKSYSKTSQKEWDRIFNDWNVVNEIMQKCAKARGE